MNNRRLLALGALLSIVLAIVLFINPVEGALSIILYLGILLLVSGILLVVSGFRGQDMKAPLLVSGLFTLVLGVVFLTRPAISVELLAIFLGMWGVIAGIGTLVFSFDVAKKVFTHRWGFVVIGLVELVLGVIIINNPLATTVAVTYLIAANFLLSGIIWLIMAFHKRA